MGHDAYCLPEASQFMGHEIHYSSEANRSMGHDGHCLPEPNRVMGHDGHFSSEANRSMGHDRHYSSDIPVQYYSMPQENANFSSLPFFDTKQSERRHNSSKKQTKKTSKNIITDTPSEIEPPYSVTNTYQQPLKRSKNIIMSCVTNLTSPNKIKSPTSIKKPAETFESKLIDKPNRRNYCDNQGTLSSSNTCRVLFKTNHGTIESKDTSTCPAIGQVDSCLPDSAPVEKYSSRSPFSSPREIIRNICKGNRANKKNHKSRRQNRLQKSSSKDDLFLSSSSTGSLDEVLSFPTYGEKYSSKFDQLSPSKHSTEEQLFDTGKQPHSNVPCSCGVQQAFCEHNTLQCDSCKLRCVLDKSSDQYNDLGESNLSMYGFNTSQNDKFCDLLSNNETNLQSLSLDEVGPSYGMKSGSNISKMNKELSKSEHNESQLSRRTLDKRDSRSTINRRDSTLRRKSVPKKSSNISCEPPKINIFKSEDELLNVSRSTPDRLYQPTFSTNNQNPSFNNLDKDSEYQSYPSPGQQEGKQTLYNPSINYDPRSK